MKNPVISVIQPVFTRITYEKVTTMLEEYLQESGYTVSVVEAASVIEAYEAFTGQPF